MALRDADFANRVPCRTRQKCPYLHIRAAGEQIVRQRFGTADYNSRSSRALGDDALLLPERQRASDLEPEAAARQGYEPDVRAFLLEPTPQEEQTAFEIVLPLGQIQ